MLNSGRSVTVTTTADTPIGTMPFVDPKFPITVNGQRCVAGIAQVQPEG